MRRTALSYRESHKTAPKIDPDGMGGITYPAGGRGAENVKEDINAKS